MDKANQFLEFGKKLGLEGVELREYVSGREKEEKQRVQEEREREREEKEIERQLAREKEDKAREDRMFERDFKRLEIEKQEKEKEIKLALLDKEIELERAKKLSVSSVKVSSEAKAKMPKLPNFNDKQDSMDAYLKRFERFAGNVEWDRDNWATHLSALLQGKALDVYSRLSITDSLDYDALKEALLQRFQLTEEGFRTKFRNSRPDVGETPHQFTVRLEEYLLRWMDLAKVPETFVGLKDLVLREQFMQVSSKSLQVFLKEHKVKNVREMTDLAQQYQEAHDISAGQTNRGRTNNPHTDGDKPTFKRPQTQTSGKDRSCYHCKASDHFIRDCPQLRNKFPKVKAAAVSHIEESRGRGKPSGRGRGFDRGGHRGGYNGRNPQNDNNQEVQGDKSNVAGLIVENAPESCGTESVTLVCGQKLPIMTAACRDDRAFGIAKNMPVSIGYMNDEQVEVLRDSGCSGVVVRRSLVRADCLTGKNKLCVLVDGTVRKFPVASIFVDTPYFTGHVDALCAERPVYDLVVGNIPNVRDASDPDHNWSARKVSEYDKTSCQTKDKLNSSSVEDVDVTSAVQTRGQKARDGKSNQLKVVKPIADISISDLQNAQATDSSFDRARELVSTREKLKGKNGSEHWYEKENDLLYRYYQSPKVENNTLLKQLLVPTGMREHVLKLAHDSILGGHLGVRKMLTKVLSEFYWPKVQSDISKYCRSCDLCQKTFAKGKVTKVPIGSLPLIDTPFERVAVDLVGPIHPPSDKGNRFILTMVDFATRYPEAVALKRIDTETVAEALVEMFSRVGFPKEVLSDMGKQFTSDTMKEVGRLLSIKQLTTTPYNPACNGLVERYNGTLKTMLRKMCAEQPKQWDRFICPLLFAYREAQQESTGFSPFELLYGRTVRGPMMILKELWTNEIGSEEVKTTYEYVLDLRNRLEETVKLAQEELSKSKARYKQYADQKRKPRSLQVGEKVLILLPTDRNKLLMQLQGPYTVTEKVNEFDYRVLVKGKNRIYHINLLRKYEERHFQDEEEDDEC